ncbi:MAG TPA: DUF3147 family protein [Polyangia bacterium]
MTTELVARFLVGGALVALFALLGDLFTPKSFAGLFAGAPSVALASLALTIEKHGAPEAAVEARSMVWGAAAFFVYAAILSGFLHRHRSRPTFAALGWLPLWFAVAAGLLALTSRAT